MQRVKKILIKPEMSIKQALKKMDESAEKILFIVDSYDKILGAVTDGDIRRWILKGQSLNENISKAMNKNPVFLKEGYSVKEAKKFMISRKIECLPIIDDNKKIVSAVWWMDFFDDKLKKHDKTINIPVVIMAGGEGLRLHPFTKVLPKGLMPIGKKSVLESIIDKFAEYGCKDFYLSLNYKANIIKAYFSDIVHHFNISYVQEKEPLGTAGSLYLLKKKIKETFFVTNCDILIEADYADILKFHKDNKNKITLVGSMKHYIIPYGICEIEKGGGLKNIKEKPEHDFLVNTGLYVLEPEILDDIPENKFYHITDLINNYINKKEKVGVYPVSEKSWLDIGQLEELQNILNKFEMK